MCKILFPLAVRNVEQKWAFESISWRIITHTHTHTLQMHLSCVLTSKRKHAHGFSLNTEFNKNNGKCSVTKTFTQVFAPKVAKVHPIAKFFTVRWCKNTFDSEYAPMQLITQALNCKRNSTSIHCANQSLIDCRISASIKWTENVVR